MVHLYYFSKKYVYVLSMSRTELIFFIGTPTVLWFAPVTQRVLIRHQCFADSWAQVSRLGMGKRLVGGTA